jgi:hypothetical protein
LYQMAVNGENSRPSTPKYRANNFPNVGPKVNTGLHQLKKEIKTSPNGVPIFQPKFHPLTIGSRFHPKSLLIYENYKTRVESRQSLQTKPSMMQYLSTNRGKQVMHNNIKGHVEVIRAPPRESFAAQSSYPIINNLNTFRRNHFLQGPGLSRYQIHHQRNNAMSHYPLSFPRVPPPRAQQQRQHDFQNKSNIVETPQQKKYTQTTYRPSQLLPLHIPGPKRENIYIGSYSDSERHEVTTKSINRAIKSRRR